MNEDSPSPPTASPERQSPLAAARLAGCTRKTNRRLSRSAHLASFAGALAISAVFACSQVPDSDKNADSAVDSGDGDSGTTSSSTTNSGTTAGGVPDEVVDSSGTIVDCATLARPSTPLRRLTRFEYNNTVRDLLHTQLTPADDFPPDEIADGFSNNALVLTISDLHAEKYTLASEALAADAATRLDTLLPCDPATLGEQLCAQEFAKSFGRQVFRRALEPEDVSVLMEAFAIGSSFEKGIEIMIRAALQSPHFLFRVEFTGSDTPNAGMVPLNGYEAATRLSYLIWSSAPDELLLEAAATNQLATPEQLELQARRMLSDPKAHLALGEFYRQWLDLTRLDIVTKDVAAFPLWSEAMRAAMKVESDAVVEDVVFGDMPFLSQLLTVPSGVPTGPLAQLYRIPESSEVTVLPATERAGVTTLPGFMAVHAHPDQTSPVLRGKFIREKLLCQKVSPPPDNVDISAPAPSEGGTARERFSAHSADASCVKCHSLMDPLGYTFESYDALGAYRTTDAGAALDLTGEFVKTSTIDGPFADVHEMLAVLAGAEEVRDCVATQWYKFAMGRGTEAGDLCSVSPLQDAFSQSGGNLLDLVLSTIHTEAFRHRLATTQGMSP